MREALAKPNRRPNLCSMALDSSSRTVLSLTGADAQALLNDVVTNTIPDPAGGAATYAALLTPQGKVLADFFVLGVRAATFYLDVRAPFADALVQRLRLYILRRQVMIAPVPNAPAIAYADPRLPDLPPRILGQESMDKRTRIGLALPDLAVDSTPEEVFALEALLDELHGVDFQKGCFVGQENVSRMKRRATTRRKFCRIVFDGPAIPFGAPILAGEAAIGAVRSCVAGTGLALLRLDRAREAQNAGQALMADVRAITLDPPDWLLFPTEESP
jgi:folate-binding protein YgfZ